MKPSPCEPPAAVAVGTAGFKLSQNPIASKAGAAVAPIAQKALGGVTAETALSAGAGAIIGGVISGAIFTEALYRITK